jgi:hypothetical protein
MTDTKSYIADIIALREEGKTFAQIAKQLDKTYGLERGEDSIRKTYNEYKHLADVSDEQGQVRLLKEVARVKKQNSLSAKKSRVLAEYLNNAEDILEAITETVAVMSKAKFSALTPPKQTGRTKMTVEALISDVHIGKKSATFDDKICQVRLDHYRDVLLGEIARKQQTYDVERIVLGFLGDNIENALMHGRESQMGCEFGNPEQVSKAIEYYLTKIILPVAALGLPVDIIGIAGNHDREEMNKTFHLPGKNSLNWIIVQSLKRTTEVMGITNITWHIPEGSFYVLPIYDNNILFEHGDRIKGGHSRRSYTNHIADRSMQYGQHIHGMRIGHIHQFEVCENGKVIVNASVCGPDSYSEEMAFTSVPGQAINYYVSTKNRSSAYYHSFLVQMEQIK